MKPQTALVPEYMLKFHCIGSECEDSCCVGWKVNVDQKSYEKLITVQQTGLREDIKKSLVKLSKDTRTSENYAYMDMIPQTYGCRMLNEEQLCKIQASLGERMLPPVCATYPRQIYIVDGRQEISATLSCPEAARLALLHPKKMEFLETDPLLDHNIFHLSSIDTRNDIGSPELRYFWDIRMCAIEIIQNREFSFPHRLIILGLFCEHIQQIIVEKREEELPFEIEQFKQQIQMNEELRDYSIFPVNHEFQLSLLNQILVKNMGSSNVLNPRLQECLQDYIEGLCQSNETIDVDLLERFEEAYNQYYQPFMNEHEYIMENYVVNFLYSRRFPSYGGADLFIEYTVLAINCVLIKMLLIGMSAKYASLSEERVVKLIQSFVRKHEHSYSYASIAYEMLQKEQYTTMGHLCLLIKN